MAKANGSAKMKTKSALIAELAEATSLNRKQVIAIFDELSKIIKKEVSKKGPGKMNVFRLVQILRKDVPAQPAGMRKNPFTGEMKMAAAKPASSKIKVRPLRDLKGMV
jgi:nucleoid DNA-binding protein